MGRKPSEKKCCACLKKGLNFNKLSKKDKNLVTLFTKLKNCVKEVDWIFAYHICIECTDLLLVSYGFRETCLNSDIVRKGKVIVDNEEKSNLKKEIVPEQSKTQEVIRKDAFTEGANINIKDETYNEEQCITAEDNDQSNDLSYCSETGEDNEGADIYIKDGEYNAGHYITAEDNDLSCCKMDQDNEKSLNNFDKEYKHKKPKIVKTQTKEETKLRKKRKKIKFECEKCKLNFSASTKLVNHCIREHGMDLKDIKPFVCDRCFQKFSTSSNLWQHIKYHDGIKSNICFYCGKGFVTKTDLVNHEKKHLNMREYKCESCCKSFNTHKDLRSHKLIVHTDSSKWKYVCKICKKPFPIKSNYDSHMRRHTGDKKFACHLCDKKFTTKCDLQRHTRSHSHVREHRCQHCEKEYKDERVLKVHMAKIHSIGLGKVKIPVRERKYACHFCPKAYYAKNKLTRHIYTHSGEKPFSCPICEKKFNDKSYVKQHLRNTHNVEQQDTLENELKIKYMNSPLQKLEPLA